MDYPSLPYTRDSKITEVTGRIFERARNGRMRGRELYSSQYELEITHPLITNAEHTTLRTSYDNAGLQRIMFTDLRTGERYACIWQSKPEITEKAGPRVTVVCKLYGELV